jgi:hypothetical protein
MFFLSTHHSFLSFCSHYIARGICVNASLNIDCGGIYWRENTFNFCSNFAEGKARKSFGWENYLACFRNSTQKKE